MSDTPRSDGIPTRFSTPDEQLDDHRFQPESLPRAGSVSGAHVHPHIHARRGTRESVGTALPTLSIGEAIFPGPIARDFEHAVVDEEDDRRSLVSPMTGRRRSSDGPIMPRHNKFNRERESSVVTSRSSSPPNSVDAFAGPRRRPRAGTFGTIASQDPNPSFLSLHRTHSASSYQRRRTFSEDRGDRHSIHELQQDPAEDDICFPSQDVPSTQFAIDFDDLNEFISKKTKVTTPYIHAFGSRRDSAVQAQKAKIFQDLRKKTSSSSLRQLATLNMPPPMDSSTLGGVDAPTSVDEKDIDMSSFEASPPFPAPRENINRWSFFSSRLEETIYAPELADLLMPGETFQHLFELGPDGGVWWLDMLMPSQEEVEVICKAFNVHGLTREDIVTQETREKVELFKSYYFVCFRSFYQMDKTSEYYMEPVNVYAVVFREGIITFTFCPSPHIANVRKRMGKLRDFVALGSDWICYALIDDIVDSFQPVIRQVEHEAEGIEDDIFTARAEDSRAVLRHIGECRRKVMSLIRLIGGKADVIKGFAKRCNEQYSIAPRQDVGMYLSDIQDHVVTMMSNLGHFEKILSRSHANYLAQISVDSIAQGNRANEALSKVTFIATILVPLNLVCGLFGMNVNVPGKNADGLGWFFGIVGVMLGLVLISLVVARKRRII